MNTSTTLLLAITAALVFVTIQAWVIGNDKRDITLLGVFTGIVGLGTTASAFA